MKKMGLLFGACSFALLGLGFSLSADAQSNVKVFKHNFSSKTSGEILMDDLDVSSDSESTDVRTHTSGSTKSRSKTMDETDVGSQAENTGIYNEGVDSDRARRPFNTTPNMLGAALADLNNDCELTEADTQLFLQYFEDQMPQADLAAPQGEFTFFDVSVFLKVYNRGFSDEDLQTCLDNQNDSMLEPCDGFENEHIYPVTTLSGTMSCPSANARVIYASARGNDGNDGLSSSSPKLSISAAKNLLREGQGDWLVLRRGDIFAEQNFGGTDELDGIDAANPTVVSAYGDQLSVRPIIRTPAGGSGITIKEVENFTIADIMVQTPTGSGGVGLYALVNQYNPSGVRNLVVENVVVQGFNNNMNIQVQQEGYGPIDNILLKDNILIDAASGPGPGGHSQGLFISGPEHVRLENNIFDHNGYIDRDCVSANCLPDGAQGATVYNHNVYWQKNSGPANAIRNIITRASASGFQARSGGTVSENIFARNPSAFFLGGFPKETYKGQPSYGLDNVVLESLPVNSGTPNSTGIRHKTAYDATYSGNVVANSHPLSPSGASAFQIRCSLTNDYGQNQGEIDFGYDQCAASIVENAVFNFSRDNIPAIQITGGIHALPGTHVISGNEIVGDLSSNAPQMINVHQSAPDVYDMMVNGDKFSISNNVYHGTDVLERDDLFRFKSQNINLDFMEWVDLDVENNPSYSTVVEFSDPCRTLATYYDDVILGNTNNDNCAIMHDDQLFDDFMTLLRTSRNRLVRNDELDTVTILNYIREGFDKDPVE